MNEKEQIQAVTVSSSSSGIKLFGEKIPFAAPFPKMRSVFIVVNFAHPLAGICKGDFSMPGFGS